MQAEQRQVARGDISLSLQVAGSGPLVLMVHGFPELSHSWRHQMEPIASAGFTAAALDVRGYGASSKPAGIEAYAIDELADDIAAVIDELGGGSAILIGHDWGAPQVYAAALRHPEKVRGVVGLSVPAMEQADIKPSDMRAAVFADRFFYQTYFQEPGVAERELEADVRRFLKLFYVHLSADRTPGTQVLVQEEAIDLLSYLPNVEALPEWLTEEDLETYTAAFRAGGLTGPLNRYRAQDLDFERMQPYAGQKITAPGLFVGGALDPVRDIIPGLDLYADPTPRFADPRGAHIIEDAGHWVQQEAPEEVNAFILRFLKAL